jgi:hypothetical protein
MESRLQRFGRAARARPRWRPLALAVLLALVMVGSVLVLRLDRDVADAYIAEDGPVESFGAICLLVGASVSVVGYSHCRRTRADGWRAKIRAFSYLALALFLFMAAGEELSWGQRLLGFGTPDALQGINAQGETTLHNLYGDENGQNALSRLFQIAWVLFGVVVPLAAAAWPAAGRFLRGLVPVAPVWLAFLLIGQQLLWHPVEANFRRDPAAWHGTYRAYIGGAPFRINSRAEAQQRGISSPAGLSEIMETNVELLLAVGAICVVLGSQSRSTLGVSAPARPARELAAVP